MKKKHKLLRFVVVLFMALALLSGCGDDDDDDDDNNGPIVPPPPASTTGSIDLSVIPSSAMVMVSGPSNFTFNNTGSSSYSLDDLEPGNYTVDVSATGFMAQRRMISVTAGETESSVFTLVPEPATGRLAFYVNRGGQVVDIPETAFDSPGNFVFYSWLADREGGIDTDPIAGAPSNAEQFEVAPGGTQNVAAAFVGIRIENDIFPVVNAAVRWEIDRQFDEAVGSVQFGAADDDNSIPGTDPGTFPPNILDDQANTFTNTANVRNMSRFPVAEAHPLHNVTGIATPDTDGFTWVTLFSPDPRATARIVAVATVNGTEIGKQVLIKNFAPVPVLTITKTVEPQTVVLAEGDDARVTFTVTLTNEGDGDAANVQLRDRLTTGPARRYDVDVGTLPANAREVNQDDDENAEGFNLMIPQLSAGESFSFSFDSVISASAEQYCNRVRIASFDTEFETINSDTNAEACFNVIEPELSIVKEFVDAEGNSLGDTRTVAAGEPAVLRVRLINSGTADATGVVLSDVLSQVLDDGDAATYRLRNLPDNATAVDDTGFDLNIGTIAAGETMTFTFNARASADGTYCDMASFVSEAAGSGADEVCLTIATPRLTIAKSNTPTSLAPGNTYESTITITNAGNAPATGVVVTDRSGLQSTSNTFAEYVSSNLGGTAGTFDLPSNTVTFEPITIAPDETVTVTVTSRIPNGASSGDYCDIAGFRSDAAGSENVEACVNVIAFAAVQGTIIDESDPLTGGSRAVFNSTLFTELRSNERLVNNVVVFTVGDGQFDIENTQLFLDRDPTIDPETGLVISGPADAERELVEGRDYTISANGTGEQTITLEIPLPVGRAIYAVHRVTTPTVEATQPFLSRFTWTSVGEDSGVDYMVTPEESTTILPTTTP